MFKGSPGTGKTTIGRLLAGLLRKIDIIQSETFIECQRDDLVGDVLGATEKQTAAKIEEAKGGVLFVDEAYRLNADIFGVEAINCLMKAMTVKDTVMILAGYPKQMEEFVTANPGLKRRITYEMEFPDYECMDLARILQHQVRSRGFALRSDVTLEHLETLIEKSTTKDQRTCLNGGIGEHISRHAIFHLNASLISAVVEDGLKKRDSDDDLRSPAMIPSIELRPADIAFGCTKIPQPPPPEAFEFRKDK
jgi:replication-associated recombination protein RarA